MTSTSKSQFNFKAFGYGVLAFVMVLVALAAVAVGGYSKGHNDGFSSGSEMGSNIAKYGITRRCAEVDDFLHSQHVKNMTTVDVLSYRVITEYLCTGDSRPDTKQNVDKLIEMSKKGALGRAEGN